MTAISVKDLARSQAQNFDLLLLDVRRSQVAAASGAQIPGAQWRDPALWLDWKDHMPKTRRVVVYCAHGHEINQGITAALRAMDIDVFFLNGGFSEWIGSGLETVPMRSTQSGATRWVTRERPKIDRIACPWLIKRFIDKDAEFLYVPAAHVMHTAKETGATPYDVPDVEMGHAGELCSFDAFLKKYELDDPALQHLAVIVRGADTSRLDLTPQSAGLHALSLGLSLNYADDHEMLGHGMVMYDALYVWCKSCQIATCNQPSKL